jgi:DNA polymerase III gamma/tau subunit
VPRYQSRWASGLRTKLGLESDRDRLKALTARYSREDLLRSFDLLAKAEQDVRAASQPRYALEMALVKWIHLRKLVPISERAIADDPGHALLLGLWAVAKRSHATLNDVARLNTLVPMGKGASSPTPTAHRRSAGRGHPHQRQAGSHPDRSAGPYGGGSASSDFKERFLAEIQRTNRTFYSCTSHKRSDRGWTRAASSSRSVRSTRRCASRWTASAVANRSRSRSLAARSRGDSRGAGDAAEERRYSGQPGTAGAATAGKPGAGDVPSADQPDLRARALADDGVQAMLEIFPAEIREVEEIK